MSDAIEVLELHKMWLEGIVEDNSYIVEHKKTGNTLSVNPEFIKSAINPLNEALLALEQKEKLLKWLDDKEVKLNNIKEKGWSLEQLAGKLVLINEIRKEVLEELK